MHNYSLKVEEGMACASGKNIRASYKWCIQIAKVIRGKKVERAKVQLNEAINLQKAIPITRFHRDVGHKTKIGPGRYAVNACIAVLKILENAETNAKFKGLNATSLIVYHASAKQGSGSWHYGRKRRRLVKQCHFEIVLKEEKAENKKVEKK